MEWVVSKDERINLKQRHDHTDNEGSLLLHLPDYDT